MSDEYCGNTNPSIPDMQCDLPKDNHGNELCQVCRGNHRGKCANHVRRKIESDSEERITEVYEFNSR